MTVRYMQDYGTTAAHIVQHNTTCAHHLYASYALIRQANNNDKNSFRTPKNRNLNKFGY